MSMHAYHLRLSQVSETEEPTSPVELTFENHDDIFRIIEMIKADQRFENEEEATRFVIGLKLLGGVLMRHRNTELFTEMTPLCRLDEAAERKITKTFARCKRS